MRVYKVLFEMGVDIDQCTFLVTRDFARALSVAVPTERPDTQGARATRRATAESPRLPSRRREYDIKETDKK